MDIMISSFYRIVTSISRTYFAKNFTKAFKNAASYQVGTTIAEKNGVSR